MDNSSDINRSLWVGKVCGKSDVTNEYDIMAEHINRVFQLRDENIPRNYVKIS